MTARYFICPAHKNRAYRNFLCCIERCLATAKIQRKADWECLETLRAFRKSTKVRLKKGNQATVSVKGEIKGEYYAR